MTKEGTKLVVNKKIFVSIVIAICVVAALLAATTSTTIPVKGSSLKETHSVFWQSNNENYEVRLTAALSCHKNRKTNNGNYFFSTELRKCLLFPNKQGWSELTYLMPPDVTSVPLLDYQTPSAVNSQHQRNGEHSSNVKEKFSPSVHARFLFDDWRLWESELGCQPEVKTTHQASSKHDGPPNSFSQINVSTRGFHNPTLPNNLYQLDNFCIDELGGGLFGFKEAFEKSLAIDRFLGLDEHPYAGNYPDFDRFVHPANHEPVNIVYPSTTTQLQWKTTIAASLEKHFIGKGEVPPEVFFHEDSALIVSLNTQGPENPVHQYHRYATSVALGSILNVSSVLYLMSMAADHPKYHKDRHSSKIFMLENTTLIGKLPSKLLTPAEEHELRNMHQKPKEFDRNLVNMNNVLRLPWFAAAKLPPKPISRGPLDATHIAINEIIGKTQNKFSYYGHHTSASLSGKEGCEFYRCSDLPPKCTAEYRQLHRRCAKPFAVVANTLPLIQRVNMTEVIGNYRFPNHEPFPTFVDYRPDTANYSRVVWSIATTELIKEAKRIKKDILLLKNNRPLSIEGELKIVLQKEISTGLAQLGDYQYIVHWRDRLVRRLASIDQEPLSLKERTTLATEFVEEYFSTLLERNHLMETKGKLGMPWRSQRSQLICYKRAYTSHVFYKTKQKQRQHGKNPRGTLAMLFPANCHSREVLNITYNTIQAKFGMCQTTTEGKDKHGKTEDHPHHKPLDTNRDAHPFLVLQKAERTYLQTSYLKSQSEINDLIAKTSQDLAALKLRNNDQDALYLKNYCKKIVQDIDQIQKSYDDVMMKYFVKDSDQPLRSRPLRLLFAQRSHKRPLQQVGLMLTKLIDEGLGRFIELEFIEGFTPEMYPSDDPLYTLDNPMLTPRARQQHSILTTDIFMGPHGAELHMIASLKPSALAVELSVAGYDAEGTIANSGYFTPLAFGRNIGFLKVLAHSVSPGVQSYLSLPEFRQTMSTAFCSWLAFNSVRLADEDAKNGFVTNYTHLIPWWCRGGPIPILKKLLTTSLKDIFKRPTLNLFANVSAFSVASHSNDIRLEKMLNAILRPNFYNIPSVPSGYGLAFPNCPTFTPEINFITLENLTPSFSITTPTFNRSHHLNSLPSKCAAQITLGAHGEIPIQKASYETLLSPQLRLKVLGLHSLLESVLFVDSADASIVSRLMVQGTLAVLRYEEAFSMNISSSDREVYDPIDVVTKGANDFTSPIICGEFPLNITDEKDTNTKVSRRCLLLMLRALLCNDISFDDANVDSDDTPVGEHQSNNVEQASYYVSGQLLSIFQSQEKALASFKIGNLTLCDSVAGWIVKEFFDVPGRPVRTDRESIMNGEEFSYGNNCSKHMP